MYGAVVASTVLQYRRVPAAGKELETPDAIHFPRIPRMGADRPAFLSLIRAICGGGSLQSFGCALKPHRAMSLLARKFRSLSRGDEPPQAANIVAAGIAGYAG